ncbi:MAG: sigma-70 family RNA polymerase sigma factor [Gammaproteobacteria bacterium]|jgi:RNA polymerase sigma factor (sigma-70 family)|nr:sigma-70 family RNA polymerase sigma factor [Gammaproteobacteria bacterium]MBU0770082.1 sigma-70 family RNA polymerase sigma factor [Gammaproteobacteria bacterium]MBU0855609.1 sigma-70 family RNA polymerase sigma factor [Gammaproteobacteria bacterium]MBU1848160.1 sigma-70 family RNA polymerase sigma factor [Gammaproteobacteria bacterium]
MTYPPYDPDFEAALVACARGDQAALQRIYQAEGSRLLGVALRIVRRRDVAEDVLHDAFVRIWEKASTFDATRGSARGWIYSIVRHGALNHVRNHAREVAADDSTFERMESDHASGAADPCRQVLLSSESGLLYDCLARLDAGKRSSILLAYLEGCTHSEIASRLESPLGTVKAWIRRGLQALRECLA